jgi:ATP-binding cassette subfamily C protein
MNQPSRESPNLVWARVKRTFIWVAIFSCFVNILFLTGPLYMLQIYDRVLSSQSMPTLVALTMLVVVLYGFQGIFDLIRGRILARAGARMEHELNESVLAIVLKRAVAPQHRGGGGHLDDLGTVRQAVGGPALQVLFDFPFSPLFFLVIFLIHWMLGVFALVAAAILIVLSLTSERTLKARQAKISDAARTIQRRETELINHAESIQGLGLRNNAIARWKAQKVEVTADTLGLQDRVSGFQALSKTFRMFMQSAILGVGAGLVIFQEISPGSMIAASILLGRALAPIDQGISHWPLLNRAVVAWRRTRELLASSDLDRPMVELPIPTGKLDVENVAIAIPGTKQPIVQWVNFSLEPGQAVGIVGPSASGKTTLARAIAGVWPSYAGAIRLDGAALEQWGDSLARYVGYLPQDVGLIEGSVAENISRLDFDPQDDDVIRAAKLAGAHDLITGLADGYQTQLGPGGSQLSGGQRQRIGLARALYLDPPLIVLDEPNSNLDSAGEEALQHAMVELKERGHTIVTVAHRPSALACCDFVLLMSEGRQQSFGPRDEVLEKLKLVPVDNRRAVKDRIGTTGKAS